MHCCSLEIVPPTFWSSRSNCPLVSLKKGLVVGLGLVRRVNIMDYINISIYVICVDVSDVSSTTVMLEYLKRKHPWQLVSNWIWLCAKTTQVSAAVWDCHSIVLVWCFGNKH